MASVAWITIGTFHLGTFRRNGLRNKFVWPVSCSCLFFYTNEMLIMNLFVCLSPICLGLIRQLFIALLVLSRSCRFT
ncbi:hypothetical protein D3C73_1185210 [compost metagenome]